MNRKFVSLTLAAAIGTLAGCADTGPRYGTSNGGYSTQPDSYGYSGGYSENRAAYDGSRQAAASYTGYVSDVETIQVQPGYRFGVGSVVGALAGGLLGHQVGKGSGNTAATIAGAAIGGAAGTAAESQINRQNASRVTVDLRDGSRATIVQPYDPQLQRGMRVEIVGSGEGARVIPAS